MTITNLLTNHTHHFFTSLSTSHTQHTNRILNFYDLLSIFRNWTISNNLTLDDFDDITNSTLYPAADITVDGVVASLYFNSLIFVSFIFCYEILRHVVPSIYAGRHNHVSMERTVEELPQGYNPLSWVIAVWRIPWYQVRDAGGLDAYMYLRYIQLCLKIVSVGAVWGLIILWPCFATGGGGAKGLYHFSMSNIQQSAWRLWVPCWFMWIFSFYCFYAMDKELRHYIELRMDFLGQGDPDIPPQHHYSLMIEKIPYELRSANALKEYFNSLYPDKVHSASVVLNLPELEALANRRHRVARRLEKSIAYYEANNERPTHTVGRPRLLFCGIESQPLSCCHLGKSLHDFEQSGTPPQKGDRIDSIIYYTNELKDMNEQVEAMQLQKLDIAATGNREFKAGKWFSRAFNLAKDVGAIIGFEDYVGGPCGGAAALRYVEGNKEEATTAGRTAEPQSPRAYGSFGEGNSPRGDRMMFQQQQQRMGGLAGMGQESINLGHEGKHFDFSENSVDTRKMALITSDRSDLTNISSKRRSGLVFPDEILKKPDHQHPQTPVAKHVLDNTGFDFIVDGCLFVNKNIEQLVEDAVGTTMSGTGFVTFIDLATTTSAASVPLTHKPQVLQVKRAPEPRDIIWTNAHISATASKGRKNISNALLAIGAILWSIPLTLIQALATAESLSRVPGMDWILTSDGGKITALINGYLPVVALLALICLLPIIFEWIAVNYEHRKTKSAVESGILTRYFYYQIANIYITVTAGSLWDSLADIIDHPTYILDILGKSLPTVVGYFISLLVTKILAGLPMILLRSGALSRMIFLRIIYRERVLTQRELDEIYRPQVLYYGWEYPSQLLVIMICFTYACISPIILPVGAIYFLFALVVYKKQVLYVYTPAYESGGVLFPVVIERTCYGLILAQLTLMGYTGIRQGYFQPLFLFPLPFVTLWMIKLLKVEYTDPAKNLSMERAIELDKRYNRLEASTSQLTILPDITEGFSVSAYRQPVLTETKMSPLPYRYGYVDPITREVEEILTNKQEAWSVGSSDSGDEGGGRKLGYKTETLGSGVDV